MVMDVIRLKSLLLNNIICASSVVNEINIQYRVKEPFVVNLKKKHGKPPNNQISNLPIYQILGKGTQVFLLQDSNNLATNLYQIFT